MANWQIHSKFDFKFHELSINLQDEVETFKKKFMKCVVISMTNVQICHQHLVIVAEISFYSITNADFDIQK